NGKEYENKRNDELVSKDLKVTMETNAIATVDNIDKCSIGGEDNSSSDEDITHLCGVPTDEHANAHANTKDIDIDVDMETKEDKCDDKITAMKKTGKKRSETGQRSKAKTTLEPMSSASVNVN
ncbi:hypothetical protein RFI_33382, partial [Reticulomyxa filosa]